MIMQIAFETAAAQKSATTRPGVEQHERSRLAISRALRFDDECSDQWLAGSTRTREKSVDHTEITSLPKWLPVSM